MTAIFAGKRPSWQALGLYVGSAGTPGDQIPVPAGAGVHSSNRAASQF